MTWLTSRFRDRLNFLLSAAFFQRFWPRAPRLSLGGRGRARSGLVLVRGRRRARARETTNDARWMREDGRCEKANEEGTMSV